MSGKERNIQILRDRFMDALKPKGFNISSLSRILEEKNIISHRSLQRNLQNEKMNYSVLDSICMILDVRVSYITGERYLNVEWLKSLPGYDSLKKNNRIDSNGFIILGYFEEERNYIQVEDSANKALLEYLNYLGMFGISANGSVITFTVSLNDPLFNAVENAIMEEIKKYFDGR